jgi:hypothetical protein
MRTDNDQSEESAFSQTVALAMMRLKQQLQRDYDQAYPHLRDIIPAILEQEEKNAWELSVFPHLVLPALVEARCQFFQTKLNFQPTGDWKSPSFNRYHASVTAVGSQT